MTMARAGVEIDSRPEPAALSGQRLAAFVDGALGKLLVLAIAAASAAVFLVTTGLIDGANLLPYDALRDQLLGFAESATGTDRIVIIVTSLAVGIASLCWIGRGLLRRGGSRASLGRQLVPLAMDERGVVLVDTRGICTIAETAVLRTGGLLDADVRVHARPPSPLRIRVKALAFSSIDLKQAGETARRHVRESVEQMVGLEVGEVVVSIEVLAPGEFGRGLQ